MLGLFQLPSRVSHSAARRASGRSMSSVRAEFADSSNRRASARRSLPDEELGEGERCTQRQEVRTLRARGRGRDAEFVFRRHRITEGGQRFPAQTADLRDVDDVEAVFRDAQGFVGDGQRFVGAPREKCTSTRNDR